MAQLPEQFDVSEVPDDDRSFEPIPAGLYKLQVIESKIEDTKANTGQMLTLTMEVLEGPFANRRLWDRLNIRHDNPEAQRISEQRLKSLVQSIGMTTIVDSEELHFHPFTARVTIKDDGGNYGPQNVIRYISPTQGGAKQQPHRPAQANRQVAVQQRPTQGQFTKAQAPAQRPAQGGGAKPWAKKPTPDDEIPF